VRYLARTDRTVAQTARFLESKGATAAQVTVTIDRLSALRYLDDAAYAERWIDRRLARLPMGRARLQEELLATGCPDSLVADAVDVAYRHISELALARRALRAAVKRNARQRQGRLFRFLGQRGFDEETIETVLGPAFREEG